MDTNINTGADTASPAVAANPDGFGSPEVPAINPGEGQETSALTPTAPPANGSVPGDNAPRSGLADMIKRAKVLGTQHAKGDDALHHFGRMVFDGVLNGDIQYVKGKTGKKTSTEKTDIEQVWDGYASTATKTVHSGTSLASQKSKLNAIGAWAAGKPGWEQADTLEKALAFRSKIVEQNSKIKGNKGKTKVNAVFQTMVNLAYRQLDEANADAAIDDATIENCVLRQAGAPKDMKDEFEAFNKKVEKWIGEGIRTDDLIGNVNKALKAIIANFHEAEQDDADAKIIADLRARGKLA